MKASRLFVRRGLVRFAALGLVGLCAVPRAARGEWPQWGGPRGDFTADAPALVDAFPPDGPKQLWKRELGEGYAAIVASGERLFTMTSTPAEEIVVALSAKTGETLWQHRYARSFWDDMYRGFGNGPNASPVLVGDRVITVGIAGEVRCLSADKGDLLWKIDLPERFGRRKRIEEYGCSASPLVAGGRVIIPVGGTDHAVIAVNPASGDVVWKSAPGGVSYGGPAIRTLAGRQQYLYYEPEGIVALDPATGKTLWRHTIPVDNGNHLTPPVKCDETHLFVASQFASGGGRLIEIAGGGSLAPKEKWFETKLRASCWTHIAIGDYVYGSAGSHQFSAFAATNWKTGEIAWRKRALHMAQCLYADGKLIILAEDGTLALARVSPEGLDVLAEAQVLEKSAWTPPTLVGTKLFARDRKSIVALELGLQP